MLQGLLRQLVLVPGSDATHHICPSSEPQLSVLSVPPLLSDLSVPGSDSDGHATSYGNPQMHFLWWDVRCENKCFLVKVSLDVLITKKPRSEWQWGWSSRVPSCYRASCGSIRSGKDSTSAMVQLGSLC